MPNHDTYMRRCIELAQQGAGRVSPNPMVGAVIVYQDKIIGEGWHQQYGAPHAEVNAVRDVTGNHANAADLLRSSTIYVSLEPCAHFGKTPPCADLIISRQIPEVVIGCTDPFSEVAGKGIEKLRAAGIKVTLNVLQQECIWLNRRFFTRIKKQRPYLILKWAQTADGFFAPADHSKKWISGTQAKKLVHKWRSEEDAVLVGKNTALIDDPQLSVRDWTGRNPVRIVVDRRLELPQTLHIFDRSVETIVFNSIKTDISDNLKYLELEDFDTLLPQLICYQLYLMDIQSVIIEGGAAILSLFINAGLWDEARIFTSQATWASGIPAPAITGISHEELLVGADVLQVLINPNESFIQES